MKLLKVTRIEQKYQDSDNNTHYNNIKVTEQMIKERPDLYTIPIYEGVTPTDISHVSRIQAHTNSIDIINDLDSMTPQQNGSYGYIGSIFNQLCEIDISSGELLVSNFWDLTPSVFRVHTSGGYIQNFHGTSSGMIDIETTALDGMTEQQEFNTLTNLTYDLTNVGSLERNEFISYRTKTNPTKPRGYLTTLYLYDNNNVLGGQMYLNLKGANVTGIKQLINDNHWSNDYFGCKVDILANTYEIAYPLANGYVCATSLPFVFKDSSDTLKGLSDIVRNSNELNTLYFTDLYTLYDLDYLGNEILNGSILSTIHYTHYCDILSNGNWVKCDRDSYDNANMFGTFQHVNPNQELKLYATTDNIVSKNSIRYVKDYTPSKRDALANFFEFNDYVNSSEVENTDATTNNVGSNGTNTGGSSIGGDGSWNTKGDAIFDDALPSIDGMDTGMTSTYIMSQGGLKSLAQWLWSPDFIDNVPRLFGDNPIDSIVSLQQTFASVSGTPQTIKVGTVSSGVSGSKLHTQFKSMDLGSITIRGVYGSFLDHEGASAEIYLPFIGVQPLDINVIMDSTISIKYQVDILSGNCVALLHVRKSSKGTNNLNSTTYHFNGNMNTQLPVTSKNYGELYRSLIQGLGGVALGGVGAYMGASSINIPSPTIISNNSGNFGFLSNKTPYIKISVPVWVKANNFWDYKGIPLNTTVRVGDANGYVVYSDIHVDRVSRATKDEKDEIENILKNGIII